MPIENRRAEEAFAYFTSLPPEERSYEAVATQFGVNLTTVKRWGAKGKWRRRLDERDLAIARKAADEVQATEVSARARQLKIVEVVVMKLVKGITDDAIRGSYGDLDRLLRLQGFLQGTDRSMPVDEVRRLFEYLLEVIRREIDDPEQRQRIADAIRDAINAAQQPRRLGPRR